MNWRDKMRLWAEVDALKRLQAESRRGLHSPLDALLPAILDRAFKGEFRMKAASNNEKFMRSAAR